MKLTGMPDARFTAFPIRVVATNVALSSVLARILNPRGGLVYTITNLQMTLTPRVNNDKRVSNAVWPIETLCAK